MQSTIALVINLSRATNSDQPDKTSTTLNRGHHLRLVNPNAAQTSQPTWHGLAKSLSILCAILLAHAWAIYLLLNRTDTIPPNIETAKPMLVSLIAPSEPVLVPIVEQPKPIVKSKPVQKKVDKQIRPLERPTENPTEAAAEPVLEQTTPEPQATQQEVAEPKVPPAKAPVVEEKIEPPKFGVAYLNNPDPAYPRMSRRSGEEGRVLLRVLVSELGAANEVSLEQSSGHERLDEAALDAVKKWRFIPARKNNQNISAQVLVPIKFSLSN